MNVGPLPAGTLGFDANDHVTTSRARDAISKRLLHHIGRDKVEVTQGLLYVLRYIRRATRNAFDVSAGEIMGCLEAGLAVGLVQHVANPPWSPNAAIGAAYGNVAALEAAAVGVPKGVGVTIWCDLEGVSNKARPGDVVAYLNTWHERVAGAGFHPGLYVGDSCGLTAEQLYRETRFDAFWSAYNLNSDQIPAVRGVQMRQRVARPEELVEGLSNQTMDVDVIGVDALGGTPCFLLP